MHSALITGSMPGIAASTSDTWLLGSAPNAVEAPENSLDARGDLRVHLEADDDLPVARGAGDEVLALGGLGLSCMGCSFARPRYRRAPSGASGGGLRLGELCERSATASSSDSAAGAIFRRVAVAAGLALEIAAFLQHELVVVDLALDGAAGAEHQLAGVDRAAELTEHDDPVGDDEAFDLAALGDLQLRAAHLPVDRPLDHHWPSSESAPTIVTPRLITSAPLAGRACVPFNSVITQNPRTTPEPRPRGEEMPDRSGPFRAATCGASSSRR